MERTLFKQDMQLIMKHYLFEVDPGRAAATLIKVRELAKQPDEKKQNHMRPTYPDMDTLRLAEIKESLISVSGSGKDRIRTFLKSELDKNRDQRAYFNALHLFLRDTYRKNLGKREQADKWNREQTRKTLFEDPAETKEALDEEHAQEFVDWAKDVMEFYVFAVSESANKRKKYYKEHNIYDNISSQALREELNTILTSAYNASNQKTSESYLVLKEQADDLWKKVCKLQFNVLLTQEQLDSITPKKSPFLQEQVTDIVYNPQVIAKEAEMTLPQLLEKELHLSDVFELDPHSYMVFIAHITAKLIYQGISLPKLEREIKSIDSKGLFDGFTDELDKLFKKIVDYDLIKKNASDLKDDVNDLYRGLIAVLRKNPNMLDLSKVRSLILSTFTGKEKAFPKEDKKRFSKLKEGLAELFEDWWNKSQKKKRAIDPQYKDAEIIDLPEDHITPIIPEPDSHDDDEPLVERLTKQSFIAKVKNLLKRFVVGDTYPTEKNIDWAIVPPRVLLDFRRAYEKDVNIIEKDKQNIIDWIENLWAQARKPEEQDLTQDDIDDIMSVFPTYEEEEFEPVDFNEGDVEEPVASVDDKEINDKAKEYGERFLDLIRGRAKIFPTRYYYVWWLFEKFEDYERVNQKHIYPRSRGTSKPYYAEMPTKDIADGLAGTKNDSAVTGYFLGALGLQSRNVVWTDNVPLPELPLPETLQSIVNAEGDRKGKPIIALGVARAKAFDWRLREYRGLSQTKKLRFDVTKLNWKWAPWLGKQAHGDKDELTLSGRVVDADKAESLLGINLLTIDRALKENEIVKLLDKLEDIGVKKPTVQITNDDGSNMPKITASDDGTFLAQVNPGMKKVIATKASHTGYNGEKEAITINPWPRGSSVEVKDIVRDIIIPMREEKKEPTYDQFVIVANDGGTDHTKRLAPPFGPKKLKKVAQLKDGNQTFQMHRSLPDDPHVLCLITPIAPTDDIERDNPERGVQGPIDAKDWQATFEASYSLQKTYKHQPFDVSTQLPRTTHKATITVHLTPPNNAHGNYRVWVLILKKQLQKPQDVAALIALITPQGQMQNDYCYDYNYFDLQIAGKGGDEPKPTDKKKRAEQAQEDMRELQVALGNNGKYKFAPTAFLKELDAMLLAIESNQDLLNRIRTTHPSNELDRNITIAISAGLWARKELSNLPVTSKNAQIKTLYEANKKRKRPKAPPLQLSPEINLQLDTQAVLQFGKDENAKIIWLIDKLNEALKEGS